MCRWNIRSKLYFIIPCLYAKCKHLFEKNARIPAFSASGTPSETGSLPSPDRMFSREVFNIGTGRGVSVLELINGFEKATGVKLNYQIVGRRAGDIEKVWANPDFANQELGWKAVETLEDTLRSAWNWQLKLRERGIQ